LLLDDDDDDDDINVNVNFVAATTTEKQSLFGRVGDDDSGSDGEDTRGGVGCRIRSLSASLRNLDVLDDDDDDDDCCGDNSIANENEDERDGDGDVSSSSRRRTMALDD